MSLATIWCLPDPALVTVWSGPAPAIDAALARGTPPGDLPVVIGPRGASGPPGEAGPQGPAADPGDGLVLIGSELRLDIHSLPLAP